MAVSETSPVEMPPDEDDEPIIDQAAVEAARQEGFQRGRAAAMKEFEAARAFLKKSADALQMETRRAGQRLDSAAVKLALEISAKLLERELKDPDAARENVLKALKLVPLDDKLVLRVHPATALAFKNRQDETGESDLPPHVSMVVDHSIEAGGCIVQTSQEHWDAQLSSRLALVARELERNG